MVFAAARAVTGQADPVAARLQSGELPMASRVLVGAMFGSPSLRVPTVGEPPKDVTPAATALPMPLTTPIPQYPVNARYGGTVLIETLVAPSGKVVAVTSEPRSLMGSPAPVRLTLSL